MFDAEYFDSILEQQWERIGQYAAGEIHLQNGDTCKIKGIDSVHQGYVCLEVFPQEGTDEESRKAARAARRKKGGTNEVFYDRMALAYESIAYVFLTVKDPPSEEPMGFPSPSVKAERATT